MARINYGEAIRQGFEFLLENYSDCFVIGQGLWSPWYVGNSMTDLEKRFGKERVIDSPVSENTTTGTALGSALTGMRPVVVHPRMDFMVLASDQIVNQAAKWQSMLGGDIQIPLTIRGIINRGGEQGAQHSQALHSWYGHIPGLRVVMPATPGDARDLLIASVLCDDPVVYIDDRWCYPLEENLGPVGKVNLNEIQPAVLEEGTDLTLVGAGYTSVLCRQAQSILAKERAISCTVIDLRIINPLDIEPVIQSVKKTRRLLVVDGGWKNYGLGGEIIASVVESTPIQWESPPQRLTLKEAPAPTSGVLEEAYYVRVSDIVSKAAVLVNGGG